MGETTNGTQEVKGKGGHCHAGFMFLEVMMHARLVDPWFALHVHSITPEDLLIKACQLCSLGSGHPQFLNSDVGVAQTIARGRTGGTPYSLEDARDASNVGCLELAVPGKDSGYLYDFNLAGVESGSSDAVTPWPPGYPTSSYTEARMCPVA